jgi:predicted component of viral defense system (DUF524 family)
MKREDKGRLVFYLDSGEIAGNLVIFSRYPSMVFLLSDSESLERNLPILQLVEEQVYEYEYTSQISDSRLRIVPPFTPSKVGGSRQRGTLETGSFVGTLRFEVENSHGRLLSRRLVETRSAKIDYLSDFQTMLSDIATRSIDLLLTHRSAFLASLTTDSFESVVSPQQRLFFLRSIIGDITFTRALQQIVRFPHNRLEAHSESMRFSRSAAPGRSLLTQMLTRPNRIPIPDGHPLKEHLSSIPREIHGIRKYETFDTAENRFVKHTLNVYSNACKQIESAIALQKRYDNTAIMKELFDIKALIQKTLDEDLFKDVGSLSFVPAGSPVLQRKQGYKHSLEVWNRYNSALKLAWDEAETQFFGGQKNVALLYEYWCYLQAFEVFCQLVNLEESSLVSLLAPTPDGFALNLKKGKSSAIWGTIETSAGRMHAKLTYQPYFRPNINHTANSTWSKNMSPDMSICWFPSTFPADDKGEESAADWNELHYYHLDAKYKIRLPQSNDEENRDEITRYKLDDIDKMHAYNDAINHSVGAVILYPGTFSQIYKHPSGKGQVGAIAMLPGAAELAKAELIKLIREAVDSSIT